MKLDFITTNDGKILKGKKREDPEGLRCQRLWLRFNFFIRFSAIEMKQILRLVAVERNRVNFLSSKNKIWQSRVEKTKVELKYYDWLIFKSRREKWNFMEWKTFQFDFRFRLRHNAKRLKMKSTVITQDYRSLFSHPDVCFHWRWFMPLRVIITGTSLIRCCQITVMFN